MECPHCKRQLSSIKSLRMHQATAKVCLAAQRRSSPDANVTDPLAGSVACRGCGRTIVRTDALRNHEKKCPAVSHTKKLEMRWAKERDQLVMELEAKNNEVIRLQILLERNCDDYQRNVKHKANEINKLESRICKYEQTIADIARQPRTSTSTSSTNKFVVNFPPLTTEHLQSNAQFLSMDHLKKGFQGYAEYALEFPLKGMVTCTDFSRRKVKYNNEEGDLVVDPDMKKLCTNLFSAIRSRNQELTNEYMTEMKEKAESGEWNRNDIQDLMFEAITRNGDVASIADGGRPEAITDFVKWVCSGLTSSTHDGPCLGS